MNARAAPPDDTVAAVLDSSAAGGVAIRGSALRVAGFLLGMILSIGSAAVLFRHLGVVATGQYVTVVSLIAIAQGATDFGISALALRELAVRDAAGRAALMRSLLGLRLVLTSAGVVAATAFAVVAGYQQELVIGTVLAGIGLVIQNQQGTLSVSLMSELRLGWVTLMELLRQVATVAFIIGLVAAGATLVPLLAVPIGAGVIVLGATVVLVRGHVPMRPSFNLPEWRRLFRDTLPFLAATAVVALYLRISMILVSLVATAEVAGFFGASFRVMEVLILVPGIAVSAVFPIFARAAEEDRARLAYAVHRTFQTAVAFGVWLAACIAVGAPFAIEVVAGESFEDAVPILRLQSPALAASFVAQALIFALLSLRQHTALLIVSCASLVIAAVLTLVLTPPHGGEGAAVAVVVGETACAVALAVAFDRAMPGRHLPLGVVPKAALAALAGVGAAVALDAHPVPEVILVTVIYFGVMLLVRGVPQELLDELRRARRRA
jgi:O-antigen/teichoic acid export membrane protein